MPKARGFAFRILEALSLLEWGRVHDLLECVTELVGNALYHSRSGQPGHHVVVQFQVALDLLTVSIADEGVPDGPIPPRVDAEGGFGLLLVRALSDGYAVIQTPTGRTSRCRFSLTPAQ